MDPICNAIFLLTCIVALCTALAALLSTIPALASTNVQETFLYQARSALAPQLSITTAVGLRSFRMSLPMPTRKAATFSNTTGLRKAAQESLSSVAPTRIEAPRPELLATHTDGLDMLLGWMAPDQTDVQEMPASRLGARTESNTPVNTSVSPIIARGIRGAAWLAADLEGTPVVEDVQLVFGAGRIAVAVALVYAPSAPTVAGRGLSVVETGQDMGSYEAVGMLGGVGRKVA